MDLSQATNYRGYTPTYGAIENNPGAMIGGDVGVLDSPTQAMSSNSPWARMIGSSAARGKVSQVQTTPEKITQGEWERFKAQGVPIINKLAERDTSVIEAADKEGASLVARTQQQINQANGRRIGTMTAAQQRQIQHSLQGGAASTIATNSTNARIAQRDINDANVVNAYNYSNAIGNDGLGLLTGGTNMQLQREAQNKANSKSFMSSALGMVGTVAGGMIGGPVGASIGGAIGTGLGGM